MLSVFDKAWVFHAWMNGGVEKIFIRQFF